MDDIDLVNCLVEIAVSGSVEAVVEIALWDEVDE